jgi:hypothetical protein
MAFLQDMSEESCTSATDEDGDACQYCSVRGFGSVNLCLSPLQAQTAEAMGIDCAASFSESETVTSASSFSASSFKSDLWDRSCVTAYSNDPSEDSCKSAKDEDGMACKYCHGGAAGEVCLTATQADLVTQVGFWCDDNDEDVAEESDAVELPSDFWKCLQNYQQDGCKSNSCTWCNTNTGVGFCLADAAAEPVKECNFFDCDYSDKALTEEASVDTACLSATDADGCHGTKDENGNECVWCDAAGLFAICVSPEQADTIGSLLKCDTLAVTEVA